MYSDGEHNCNSPFLFRIWQAIPCDLFETHSANSLSRIIPAGFSRRHQPLAEFLFVCVNYLVSCENVCCLLFFSGGLFVFLSFSF
jgi:hypothetical protein